MSESKASLDSLPLRSETSLPQKLRLIHRRGDGTPCLYSSSSSPPQRKAGSTLRRSYSRHRALMGRRTNPPVPCPDVAPALSPFSATGAAADLGQGSGDAFTASLLIMFSVLATCFVFLTYYAVILRQRSARRRRALRRHRRSHSADTAASADDFDGEEGGDTHHVWYIRTEGLDEDTIKSIAVVAHKSSNDGGGVCSVCLTEFKDRELVRVLPKCSHGFHVPCIDTWLRSHVNCPLCRSLVVTDVVAGPPSDSGSSFPLENSIGNASPLDEEDEEEEYITAVLAPRGHSLVLDRSNTVAGSVIIASQMDEGLQMARRTISMDCSIIGNYSLNQALEWDFQPDDVNGKEPVLGSGTSIVICEKKEHDPNVGSSQNNDCGPERSPSSGSSGHFFLSILGRNRNNAILPL